MTTLADLAPDHEVTEWSGNHGGAAGDDVYLLCLHGSVGMTDPVALVRWMNRETGNSYSAATDGPTLVYQVPTWQVAYHLRDANGRSEGLCLTTPREGYTADEWVGPQRRKLMTAAWWLAIRATERQLDLLRCSYANIRDALAGNRLAGGVIMHADYTYATGDGTHTDVRGLDDTPSDGGQTPFQLILRWAAEAAGYSDWQTREEDDMDAAERYMLETVFDQLTGPGNARRVRNGEQLEWGWPRFDADAYDKRAYPAPLTLVDYERVDEYQRRRESS